MENKTRGSNVTKSGQDLPRSNFDGTPAGCETNCRPAEVFHQFTNIYAYFGQMISYLDPLDICSVHELDMFTENAYKISLDETYVSLIPNNFF